LEENFKEKASSTLLAKPHKVIGLKWLLLLDTKPICPPSALYSSELEAWKKSSNGFNLPVLKGSQELLGQDHSARQTREAVIKRKTSI